MPVHNDPGGMNDTENLEASSDRNISVYVHSERDVGATAEQLENEDWSDNLLIEVTNNTANAPSAAQYTDEQYNSRATESTDIDGHCVGVVGQRIVSTDGNNHKSCEQHLTQFSNGVCILDADVDHGHENSNVSCVDVNTKSAPVSGELRVGKPLSSAVKQSLVQLQPKPTFTLLPVRIEMPLLVVVNTGGSRTNDHHVQLPTIAPRPADTVSGNTCMPEVAQEDSAVAGHCDSLPCDLSLPKKQQKAIASVITQTSSRARHKSAATQTSAPVSRTSKETRASQASIILVLIAFRKNRCLPYNSKV